MKHFKIQFLLNNSKIQQLWPVPKKIQILEIQPPPPQKKILRWSLSVNMPSPPPGHYCHCFTIVDTIPEMKNLSVVTLCCTNLLTSSRAMSLAPWGEKDTFSKMYTYFIYHLPSETTWSSTIRRSCCCVSSLYNRESNLNCGPLGLLRCAVFSKGFWDSCMDTV